MKWTSSAARAGVENVASTASVRTTGMHPSTTDRFLRIRNPPPRSRSRRAILRRFAAAYPPLDGEGRPAERAGVGCDLGVTPTPTPPRKGEGLLSQTTARD